MKKEGTGHIEIFDADTLEPLCLGCTNSKFRTMVGHTASCMVTDKDPTCTRLISGGFDGLANIWDINSSTCLFNLDNFSHSTLTVGFSSCGKYVTAGDKTLSFEKSNFNLCIAEAEDGKILHEFRHSCGPGIIHSKWNPKKSILAYAYALENTRSGVGNAVAIRIIGV